MELKKRKNLIFEIDENELKINKGNQNKNNNSKTNKNISITANNSKVKENIFKNLNIRLTENKRRMKNNQEKIINLFNSIKTREYIPKKSKMQRHNTEINFVKNGLNKIYTKSNIIRKHNNNNINSNKINIKTFNSGVLNLRTKIMKTSESMNDIKLGKNNKKSNIYVNKVKSTKNIYIPKKISFPLKYIQESKKKNESPIYRKKNMNNNNKINEYYFFSSDKRVKIKNKKENEGDDNINNNLRMTYSKKYYSKSNPNFLNLNEIKSETYNNNFQQNINFPYLKHFFERDIEELSSIHNDSDYDSYTFDNYVFKNNKIYDNNININRNSVYIRKTKNSKINLDNMYKIIKDIEKKEPQTEINTNKKNISKINMIFTEQKNKMDNNIKRNLRYNNSEKEFTNIYISTSNNLIRKNFDKIKVNKGKLNQVNLMRKKTTQKNFVISPDKNDQNNKNEIMYFHLYDFVILEERLKNIYLRFNNNKSIYYNCYDFLNYFRNNCDAFKNLNFIIKNEKELKIIQNGITHILISIIFLYYYLRLKNIRNLYYFLFQIFQVLYLLNYAI